MRQTSLLLLLIMLLIIGFSPSASAQDDPTSPAVEVIGHADGTVVNWRAGAGGQVDAAAAAATLPLARYDGFDLPIQTITLALPDGLPAQVVVSQLESGELPGGIAPGAPLVPQALDWVPDPNQPAIESMTLPAAPAFILREGKIHGQRLIVVALSPIYQENGLVRVASSIQAFVPGATVAGERQLAGLAAAQAPEPEAVSVENNAAAAQTAFKLIVSQRGMQEIRLGDLPNATAQNVRLTHRGKPVAFDIAGDRLRFYVPVASDRWNTTAIYWVTLDGSGSQMASITEAAPAGTLAAGQAYERGTWRNNKIYDSVYAGPDGDHWFHTGMSVDVSVTVTDWPTVTVPAVTVLPLIDGQSTFTMALTAVSQPPAGTCQQDLAGYKLRATFLNSSGQALDTALTAWNPAPLEGHSCTMQYDWERSWQTAAKAAVVRLTLEPSGWFTYPTSIKLDGLSWERPVALSFGGQGAEFWTRAGAWSYTWQGLPPNNQWRLYDVTDPANPVIVAGATSTGFNQAASPTPRHYVLARLDTLPHPSIQSYANSGFGTVKTADAIYIGPAAFKAALQPLLDLRSQQGHTPIFVDIQQIFDVYSYGYVSAPAIRSFLREQSGWQNQTPERRIGVVLVGDGTYDPYNYEAKDIAGKLYPVPPYMVEDIDPWLGEAPCDQCFAQLNGDDPAFGDDPDALHAYAAWFSADIWLGRLPVRNESELSAVVTKLVAYETANPRQEGWRYNHVLLADNYIKSVNGLNQAERDSAGDFPVFSDALASQFGLGTKFSRVYYDPAPDRRIKKDKFGHDVPAAGTNGLFETEPRPDVEPWRIAEPTRANAETITAVSAGIGLLVYNGHSNHWQYARTNENGGNSVSWLLDINDVNSLYNTGKPFIGLSMTCFTSQFPKPANTGVIDELLVRKPDGGAVAVFGPAGLTVAHGHDLLQNGFVKKLVSSPPMSQPIGALTEAAFTELLAKGSCCLDALKTFLLLGDPHTIASIWVGNEHAALLPLVNKP